LQLDQHFCSLENVIMGMFDWYRPKEVQHCPHCGSELNEWQSKDGPCALFVWEQGKSSPVDQPIDEDARLPEARRALFRLPEVFEIYSYDCKAHHPVIASCQSENGVWTKFEIKVQKSSRG
jgi:hypothetical protein